MSRRIEVQSLGFVVESLGLRIKVWGAGFVVSGLRDFGVLT